MYPFGIWLLYTTIAYVVFLKLQSNQHEDSDTDEDEEYEIFRSYYLMQKRRKDRKCSRSNEVSQHLHIDEQDLLGQLYYFPF
jgi:hypothetical protein